MFFPKEIEWIFGEDNGIKGYVSIAEDVNGWVLPYQQ